MYQDRFRTISMREVFSGEKCSVFRYREYTEWRFCGTVCCIKHRISSFWFSWMVSKWWSRLWTHGWTGDSASCHSTSIGYAWWRRCRWKCRTFKPKGTMPSVSRRCHANVWWLLNVATFSTGSNSFKHFNVSTTSGVGCWKTWIFAKTIQN